MPPQFLFDISKIDLKKVIFDKEGIRNVNPHRFEFEMLDGIVWADTETNRVLGYKDLRADEFWVRGHIPGRPLFPGVLQIEAAAQLASFYTKQFKKWQGFIGFGGVTNVKFRGQIVPGQRLILLAEQTWERRNMINSRVQGIVDGQLVFEAEILGVQF